MFSLISFLAPFALPLYALGVFYITLVLYWSIMALWACKLRGELTMPLKVLGYPVLAVGLLFDAASNLAASVILWHMPREWLLTQKLQRIQLEDPSGWRNRAAKWVCSNLLNPFDPTGHHC